MMKATSISERDRSNSVPFRATRIALLYALVAGAWIWLSDTLLARFVTEPAQFATWQTYKGWGFVIVSALLLWAERVWSDRRGVDSETILQTRMQERTSELEHVRAQLQAILDNAPVSFYMRGTDNRYILVNRQWEEYMGVEQSRALGATPAELFAPDLAEQLTVATRQVLQTKTSSLEEVPLRLHGRDYVFVRACSPLLDDSGEPYAVIGISTDITARKQMEEALRQAEERFRAVFETVRVGINLVNPEGRYVDANTTFIEMLGYDAETLFSKNYQDITHPDDLLEDETLSQQIQQRPDLTHEMEKRYLRADGTWVWGRRLMSAIRNSDGSLALYVTVVEEITARKEAEAQRQRAHEELEQLVAERTADLQRVNDETSAANSRISAILQASPLAIIAIDPEGLVQLWNPAAEQIYGFTAAEVMGKRIPSMQVPGDSAYLESRQRIESSESLVGMEARRQRPDGTIIDISISTAPLHDEQGNFTGIVALVRDITERKRTQAELQKLNQELESRVIERTAHLEHQIAERVRAETEIKALNATLAEQAQYLSNVNRELETFTYSVSHDLKAPLRGIDGYSRLLLEDYADRLDEEGLHFLNTIRNASNQMAQLIDDLLAYSRLERRTLVFGQINVRELVEKMLYQMQIEQVYPNVTVDVMLEPVMVNADSEALSMVLRNLIDNALKFSANGTAPRVEIGGERLPQSYRIFVRDNGVGFDMQYQDRIFDIFQRLHRAEDYPGTGIGLAIVRKSLQRMQGRVWAESQLGQGATFFVEIPTI